MHTLNRSIPLFRQLSSFVFFLLVACQSNIHASNISMLKPGDQVADMTLTTGALEAPPLQAFCSRQVNNDEIAHECYIPAKLPKVAIGHFFILADVIPANLDWAEVTWNLSFDEQPIDLSLFGAYDFVLPGMVSNPNPVTKEAFWKFTAWDVVLTDLKPGRYVLRGTAQSQFDTYSWVVDLIIEAPYGR